ncbi:MAG: LON peptidase substrate-binding domain-containing protein [Gemmatimonadetes bacterium]|nr:LON peptidase substrate-binding domain-containing protein [Gemmatimonadota bacterium]
MEPTRLPLFPLPIVLFPGTLVPLHIFEQRYRDMVADVLDKDKRFGLLYHDPDESGPFLTEEGRVGTVAVIKRHQPLPDGRSMILVRGEERFRIHDEVESDALYYEALVGPYEDKTGEIDPAAMVARRKRSLALFKNILQTQPHVPETMPSFSVKRELSFRLAGLVRMDPFWQRELLELRDESARLDRLDPVFQAGIERWWADGGLEA